MIQLRMPASYILPENARLRHLYLRHIVYGKGTILNGDIQPACLDVPTDVFDLTTEQVKKIKKQPDHSPRTAYCQKCPVLTACRMLCDIDEHYSRKNTPPQLYMYGGETFYERSHRRLAFVKQHNQLLPWYMTGHEVAIKGGNRITVTGQKAASAPPATTTHNGQKVVELPYIFSRWELYHADTWERRMLAKSFNEQKQQLAATLARCEKQLAQPNLTKNDKHYWESKKLRCEQQQQTLTTKHEQRVCALSSHQQNDTKKSRPQLCEEKTPVMNEYTLEQNEAVNYALSRISLAAHALIEADLPIENRIVSIALTRLSTLWAAHIEHDISTTYGKEIKEQQNETP